MIPIPAIPAWPAEVASTLNAAFGDKQGLEDQHINGGAPLFVPVSIAMRGREGGAQMEIGDDCAFTLRASTGGGDKPHVFAPVAFDTTQITSAGNYSNPKAGDPCHPLAAGAHPPAIAFDCKGSQVQFSTDGSHPTLRSMGHDGSHQNGGGHAAVAFAIQERATCENPNAGPDGAGFRGDGAAYTLEARSVPQAVATPWAVRRLTPTECARLQAFPDDHTRIEWRGKPADQCPDGPQYKALGNSMTTSVVKWIMDRMRISMEENA